MRRTARDISRFRCFVVPQTKVSDHTGRRSNGPVIQTLEACQYVLLRFPPAVPFIDHSMTTLKSIASGTCYFARETKWQQSPTWSLEKEGAHSLDHLKVAATFSIGKFSCPQVFLTENRNHGSFTIYIIFRYSPMRSRRMPHILVSHLLSNSYLRSLVEHSLQPFPESLSVQ